jgi:hypothetical protein
MSGKRVIYPTSGLCRPLPDREAFQVFLSHGNRLGIVFISALSCAEAARTAWAVKMKTKIFLT